MENCPITFKFKDKQYAGHFKPVSGGGSNTLFHLMVDNYYWGQLFYTENFGWQFHSNSEPELKELSEYFGMVVSGWYRM